MGSVFQQFPSRFDSSHSVVGFIHQFATLPDGARLEDETVTVAGRITAKRDASGKLSFYDLTSDGATVQVRMPENVAFNLNSHLSVRLWQARTTLWNKKMESRSRT
jgi:lysyl-tRNA synthetase class II